MHLSSQSTRKPIRLSIARTAMFNLFAPGLVTFGSLALLAAAVLLLGACSQAAVPVQEDIRSVRTMTVAPARTQSVAEFSGEIKPRIESRIGFQVSGRVTQRLVEVGQTVAAGTPLAAIDAADYRLSAAASSAQLAAAQADRDQQRLDYGRFVDLNRQGFTSGADLERRKAQLDAAEARYEQASAQASVSGNQTAYATLRAPVAGVVTAVEAEVGQVVAAGQPVIRIAQTREKEVAIAIPENRLEALRLIPEVQVSLWTGGAPLRGRVREISPIADPATRTFPARISLIDPPASVAWGMTATVRFATTLPSPVIALPLQSLVHEGGNTYVWQLDRATQSVRRNAIQVANVSGNDVVVTAGVNAGDTIVTAGVHLLKEGQRVKPLDAAPVAAPLAPAIQPLPQKTVERASGLPASTPSAPQS